MLSILKDQEIVTLLLAAKKSDYRDFAMIYLALSTGLRVSEIVGLFVEDVKPYGEISTFLTVPARIAKRHRKRQIPINSETREVLKKWFELKVMRNHPLQLDSYLFLSHKTKKPLHSRTFQYIVHNISVSALGRPVTPHTLRHTFATNILKKNNLRIVQDLLGHKSIQTTQIYTHVTSDDLIKAVDSLSILH